MRPSAAITARIPASVPKGEVREGVAVGLGIVVTIVVGKGVVAVKVTGTVVTGTVIGGVVAGR